MELMRGHPGPLSSVIERDERMKRQAKASRAENSWKAYRSDWRQWEAWASTNGVSPVPADPEHVATFLSDASETRKIATLRRYVSSIAVAHELAGDTFDRKHTTLRTLLKGIAREKAEQPRRVKPITSDRVRAMVANMGTDLRDTRDAALLALGVASGCRRSELSGLDWAVHGEGTGVVEFTDDGATITLYRSKASQDAPAIIYLAHGLALTALRTWVEGAGIQEGTPLYRRVGKGGKLSGGRLSDRSIATIIKRRCNEAGLESSGYSGHSLRSGMITSCAEAGLSELEIGRHSRHKSSQCLRAYVRDVEGRTAKVNNRIGL